MDPRNDPGWKIGQQAEQQNLQRAFQRAQGWANKEQYYQNALLRLLGFHLPLAIAKVLWKFARSVFFIYFAPFLGAGLAYLCFAGAVAMQQGKGFFSLSLGLGTVDALIFLLGAAFAAAALAGMGWGFWTMTWIGKILALFFFYSLGVWSIHHFEADAGWKAGGAWFFCVVLSSMIEGIALFVRNRKAGTAPA